MIGGGAARCSACGGPGQARCCSIGGRVSWVHHLPLLQGRPVALVTEGLGQSDCSAAEEVGESFTTLTEE